MTDSYPATLAGGRYAVSRVLGEGAQGATLEAVDKKRGELVAIKRFRVRGAKQWKDVELAEREAQVLSTLSHPALPVYVDHFEEDGALHLVMKRLEGESLAALRQAGRRFTQADVLRFLHEAGDVLDYLHGRAPPVIHRDIKPSNVLLRPEGSFALIDFGSVRQKLEPAGGSTVVGTFGYMAPEQFQGRALPASDVYSVGATAMALLTGMEPEDLPHKGLSIDVKAALGRSFDPRLVHVLERMLEPDPDQRAGSITPLLYELGEMPRRPRKPKPHARRRSRRRRRASPADGLLGNPVLMALLLVGLTVARIATFVLLELLLPVLLTVLSIVFGRGMRDTASNITRAGMRGRAALSRAATALRERADDAAARRHFQRTGVRAPPPGPRVRVDPEADDEEWEAEREAELEAAMEEAERRKRRH